MGLSSHFLSQSWRRETITSSSTPYSSCRLASPLPIVFSQVFVFAVAAFLIYICIRYCKFFACHFIFSPSISILYDLHAPVVLRIRQSVCLSCLSTRSLFLCTFIMAPISQGIRGVTSLSNTSFCCWASHLHYTPFSCACNFHTR